MSAESPTFDLAKLSLNEAAPAEPDFQPTGGFRDEPTFEVPPGAIRIHRQKAYRGATPYSREFSRD